MLDVRCHIMCIKVPWNPGHRMNFSSRDFRDEVWTVIAGEGRAVIDDVARTVKVGDVLTMKAGCKHTIIADTELQVIEVQIGDEISVHDKHKF